MRMVCAACSAQRSAQQQVATSSWPETLFLRQAEVLACTVLGRARCCSCSLCRSSNILTASAAPGPPLAPSPLSVALPANPCIP
jgi:hypothetical protein